MIFLFTLLILRFLSSFSSPNYDYAMQITTWLKDLTTHANISYKESMTIPRDRKKWRSVGNPRRTPDE